MAEPLKTETRMSRVADIMTRNVETIGPSATVQEAAERMKADNIGSLPVCSDSRLVGTLTDRDITIRVTAEGRDSRATLVREVMTRDLVTVRPQQEVAEAQQLMHDHQVRRLPVVETDGRLVGYVTTATIARKEGDEKAVGRVLKGISQPRKPAPEPGAPRSRAKTGTQGA
jgi:CBS domain-containing protein